MTIYVIDTDAGLGRHGIYAVTTEADKVGELAKAAFDHMNFCYGDVGHGPTLLSLLLPEPGNRITYANRVTIKAYIDGVPLTDMIRYQEKLT